MQDANVALACRGLDELEELVAAGRWQWDVENNTLRWSPELSRIYGLAPGTAPDGYEDFLRMVHPEDRGYTKQVVARALEERHDAEYRHRIIRADGALRVLRSRVQVDTDERGVVVRLSGACQDVTAQVALEERLRRLEGLATAGNVAAGLAHDLNNMVGGLLLLTGALEAHDGPPPPELLDNMSALATRAAALASRIQDVARHAPASPARIDLREAITEISLPLSDVIGERYDLVVRANVDDAPVRIDRTDLTRVLWNLVLNARDAMPPGGPIYVTLERVTVIGAGRTGPCFRVTVEDEGEGMDEITCARLFEPLFSTKKGNGTGLGLSVVHDIVERAGGFVTADSRLGEGTRIRVHLPPLSRPSGSAAAPAASEARGRPPEEREAE